jgi:hypothetical protein
MNKALYTIILLSLLMKAKGQDLKVINLDKSDALLCSYKGGILKVDTLISDQRNYFLTSTGHAKRIGINDTLSIGNVNYIAILFQPKVTPVSRDIEIDDRRRTSILPQIPKSLGVYYNYAEANSIANNSTAIKFKSTIYDLIWLRPVGFGTRFYAERINPKKFRK